MLPSSPRYVAGAAVFTLGAGVVVVGAGVLATGTIIGIEAKGFKAGKGCRKGGGSPGIKGGIMKGKGKGKLPVTPAATDGDSEDAAGFLGSELLLSTCDPLGVGLRPKREGLEAKEAYGLPTAKGRACTGVPGGETRRGKASRSLD